MTNVAVTPAPQAIVALAAEAAPAAAAAIEDIARQARASTTGVPVLRVPGIAPEVLRIVSRLEHARRAASAAHVYRAREADLSWHEARALLGFGELADHSARTVGEMAVDYPAFAPDERLV